MLEDADVEAIAEPVTSRNSDLLALDEVLTEFEEKWPDRARRVKLRYFAGLTILEAAHAIGVSVATADRHWDFGETWMHVRLHDSR